MRQRKTAILSIVLVFCCTLIFAACQNQVTVRFMCDDDDQSIAVTKGEKVTPPEYDLPIGIGYVWYTSTNDKWDFNTPVTENMTLYGSKGPVEITIAQALELCGEAANEATTTRYLVRGIIKSIINSQYGEMTITDGTNDLYVYGSYSSDGEKRYSEMDEKPYKGDEVLLYCALQNYQGKTKQAKSAWIMEFKEVDDTSYNEADYSAMSIEYARFTDAGKLVKVTGVVSQIIYADGMKPCGFYLIDNTSSIYVYDSQVTPQVKAGNTVTICAEKAYYILESEKTNAMKFGYLGCNQLQDAHLVSNDSQTSQFNKGWIQEKTVKEIMETPASEDIASLTYKTNALIRKVPGSGFVNYYINDLDGTTGSYVYTMCSGKDFAWMDQFDGKICTVYLSPLNAKSAASGCSWRFIPVAVQDDNYQFDKAYATEFAVKYYAADQFMSAYQYGELTEMSVELTTNVSSDLLGIENVTISYTSSNPSVMAITQNGGITTATLRGVGKTTITMTATNDGYKGYTQTKEINVTAAETYPSALTAAQAVSAEIDKQITLKGIVGPSLVNQDGFYLLDETGIIAVKTTASVLSQVKLGNLVVLKGTRYQFNSADNKTQFGQSCVLDCELLVNYYGNHEYSTDNFVTTATFTELKELSTLEDHTTTAYILENVQFIREETEYYTKMIIKVGEETMDLYSANANQYRWLNDYAESGKTFKIELALCNWNGKEYYRGCVLAVYEEDGTKVYNTLNFQQ